LQGCRGHRDGPADRADLSGCTRSAYLRRRQRAAEARDERRIDKAGLRSTMTPIDVAPDDIVQTAQEGAANEREPLLVLDPLREFLDEHGLGSGGLRVEPVGEG